MTTDQAFRVSWTRLREGTEERDVANEEEALMVLRSVAKSVSRPTMVEFFDAGTGLSLAVGTGGRESVVTFQESLDPPYFISLGAVTRDDVVCFLYGNEDTEYLGRNAVSVEAAETALVLFVRHRAKPPNLAWECL